MLGTCHAEREIDDAFGLFYISVHFVMLQAAVILLSFASFKICIMRTLAFYIFSCRPRSAVHVYVPRDVPEISKQLDMWVNGHTDESP